MVLEEGVCYDQCILLAKLYVPLPCFILYSKVKFACYSSCFLTSYFCILVPYIENIFFPISSNRSFRSSWKYSTSASSALLVRAYTWITVILKGLPWKPGNGLPWLHHARAAKRRYLMSKVRSGGYEEIPHVQC